MEQYNPILEKLNIKNENIFKTSLTPIKFSKNINYPKFTFGFQHFLHATKNKMDLFDTFKGKKKVYLVINEFEKSIDDYTDSIENYSIGYFGLNEQKISSNILKIWEILSNIDNPILNNNLTTLIIAHDPTPFSIALSHYRKLYYSSYKNDKYITANKIENIKITPSELVIIDVNHMFEIESSERNLREQLALPLLIQSLYYTLKSQKKNGILICKFYETYTISTVKLISMLSSFYKTINFYKPLISRNIKAEKYLICSDFTENKNYIDIFEQLYNVIIKSTDKYLVDFFPDYKLSEEFINSIISINNKISNKQYIQINKMITFINNQNYYGDVYHKSREAQIEANKYWLDRYILKSQ